MLAATLWLLAALAAARATTTTTTTTTTTPTTTIAEPELRLQYPLPSMEEWVSGAREAAAAYHQAVGVPAAARIRRREAAGGGARVVGGLASYRGEHPFMAGLVIALSSGETSVCGGALVSSARVLTAASCYWDGASVARAVLVVLGSVTLFAGGTRVPAASVAVHAAYSPASIHCDLAVLGVPPQPRTEFVAPIALSTAGEFAGARAQLVGYGRTADSAPVTSAASLRDLFTTVLSNAECQLYYGAQVSGAEMCSSGAGGRNPCGGDQGGPLLLRSSAGNHLLLGVFTFGSSAGCAAGAPAGYQRVAHHRAWIAAQL